MKKSENKKITLYVVLVLLGFVGVNFLLEFLGFYIDNFGLEFLILGLVLFSGISYIKYKNEFDKLEKQKKVKLNVVLFSVLVVFVLFNYIKNFIFEISPIYDLFQIFILIAFGSSFTSYIKNGGKLEFDFSFDPEESELPKSEKYILQLYISLIQLDESKKIIEYMVIKKFLYKNFNESFAQEKYSYLLANVKIKYSLDILYEKLNNNFVNGERVIIIKNLIDIAVSDKLLSKKEQVFIENTAREIGIPKTTLKSIFAYFNYISEEELNRKKTYSPSNYKKLRAFTMLGLEENAAQEEIKKSYRELVKIYHPDKLDKKVYSKAALERAKVRFQEVKDAYELLNN